MPLPLFFQIKHIGNEVNIMYELVQAGAHTYYLDCPAKVGVYELEPGHICLFDSGSDVSAARKLRHHLQQHNWSVDFILNTHSHADHIGGNHYFQKRYGCAIYAMGQERPFVQWPVFEPTFLFGGDPVPELRNKFLEAQASEVQPLETFVLPAGLELIPLQGHAPDMVGIKTPDDVAFLADCVASEATIQKHHLTYLHDVERFLDTLDAVEQLDCACYIPAHTQTVTNIEPLTALNRAKVEEIAANILRFCREGKTFEEVLQCVFTHYSLRMDMVQYALIGVTTRAYLSHLHKKEQLAIEISDNRLYWKTV